MRRFDKNALDQLSRFYRGNLMNCLTGVKPALLFGTKSADGKSNLALFSSVFHVGANPSMFGFIQRPLTGFSHTYRNIIETGVFTVNHIPESFSAQAHATSAKYDECVSEFDACGFTEAFVDTFHAPFVKESPVRLAATYLREIPVEENRTRIILANIEEIYVDDSLLLDDGNIDPSPFHPLAVFGLETYLGVSVKARYAYAKPGVIPVPIA